MPFKYYVFVLYGKCLQHVIDFCIIFAQRKCVWIEFTVCDIGCDYDVSRSVFNAMNTKKHQTNTDTQMSILTDFDLFFSY